MGAGAPPRLPLNSTLSVPTTLYHREGPVGAGAVVLPLPTHHRAAKREVRGQHARQRGRGQGDAAASGAGKKGY